MKITFVALSMEQLPLSLLASVARENGHETDLAFAASLFNDRFQLDIPTLSRHFDDTALVLEEIERQRPQVIAASVLTSTYQWFLDVARHAKAVNPGVKVIFGGVHPSAVPELVVARPEVDAVCIGEGEEAFPLWLDAVEQGDLSRPIPNMIVKAEDGRLLRGPQKGFIQDLDSLPAFDKHLWEEFIDVGDPYMTMSSRGCPYRCTFCFNNFFARLPEGQKGKYVRQRSVDHMMAELTAAKRRYKLRLVDFEDDIFTVNKGWLAEFLPRYKKEIGVPFKCLTHPKYIDAETADWLADAGCTWAQMGVQSVDEDFKFRQLKRYEKQNHVEQAIDAMERRGIHVKCDHIFGLPGEPENAQMNAWDLYADHTPSRVGTYWAAYYPGTEMVQQGLDLNLITPEDVDRINTGEFVSVFHTFSAMHQTQRLDLFSTYELIFRLMPLFPRRIRRTLTYERFRRIPAPAAKLLGMSADILNGLVNRNPDHWSYLRHYGRSILRFARRRLRLETPQATKLQPATTAHGELQRDVSIQKAG